MNRDAAYVREGWAEAHRRKPGRTAQWKAALNRLWRRRWRRWLRRDVG